MFQQAKRAYLLKQGHPLFQPQAALIDMDGVLFDSMPNHAKSWVTTIHGLGFAFDEKEAYLHEGRTGRGTIETIFQRELQRLPSDEEVKEIYGRKSGLFDSLPEAPVIKGASRVLDTIRDSGRKRILVTGSGQRKLLNRINAFFPGHFSEECMVTAFDVKKGKPHPEPYLMGLKKGKLEPWQSVVIENAPLGILSAKAAGIFTIAVNTGLLDDHYLYDAGCDLLFHSMDELADAWPDIILEESI